MHVFQVVKTRLSAHFPVALTIARSATTSALTDLDHRAEAHSTRSIGPHLRRTHTEVSAKLIQIDQELATHADAQPAPVYSLLALALLHARVAEALDLADEDMRGPPSHSVSPQRAQYIVRTQPDAGVWGGLMNVIRSRSSAGREEDEDVTGTWEGHSLARISPRRAAMYRISF